MNDMLTDQDMLEYLQSLESLCSDMLGHRVTGVNVEAGIVRNEFVAKPEFCNPAGVVQGGMLSSMLDTAMTMAGLVASRFQAYLPTLEMKTTYTGPALPGKLTAEGRVVHMGKSIIFLDGNIYDPDNNLVATASATVKMSFKRSPTGE